MAAKLTVGTYADNNFASILESSGPVWREEFEENPELLVVWSRYFYLTGGGPEHAKLHAPAWYAERIVDVAKRHSPRLEPAEAKRVLARDRLVGKFFAGEYIVILYDKYSEKRQSSLVMPVVLRMFSPGEYRITGELRLSAIVNYLASLAPGLIASEQASRQLSTADLRNLVMFEEVVELPGEGEQYAPSPVFWREPGYRPQQGRGKVFFYCSVHADEGEGYGARIDALSSRNALDTSQDGPVKLGRLLHRVMNVQNVEEQKALWAEYVAPYVESNYQNALQQQIQAGLGETLTAKQRAARAAVPGDFIWRAKARARAVASVATEYGAMYYLDDGRDDFKAGSFVPIVLLPGDRGGMLSSTLAINAEEKRAGYITGVLVTTEFKRALGQYVERNHPLVVRRLSEGAASSKPE